MYSNISYPSDIDNLVDIRSVKIDAALPIPIKKESYMQQIGNPQCFRYDDITVRVSYVDTGASFKDRLRQLLLSGQGMDLVL